MSPPCLTGFAAALILVAVLSWTSIQNYRVFFGMYHDDGIYLVSAQSLAEGSGYRMLFLPGEPAQTKYPIGFSFLLSLIWRAFPSFPDNLTALEIGQVVIAVALPLVAATYLIATRRVTPALGLVIFAISALNRRQLDFAPMLMSDLPCALLSVLALWRTEIVAKRPFNLVSAALLGLIFGAVATIRMQGLLTVATCLIYLCLLRRFRQAGISLVVSASVIAPQMIWSACARSQVPQLLSFYVGYISSGGEPPPTPAEWWSLFSGAKKWFYLILIRTFFPFLSQLPLPQTELQIACCSIVCLFFMALIWVGLWGDLRRSAILSIFWLMYGSHLFFYPVYVEWRHILPSIWLAYYFYFRGWRLIARGLKPRWRALRRPYQSICAASAILFSGYLLAGTAIEAWQKAGRYEQVRSERVPLFSPQVSGADYAQSFAWIKANTKLSDTFICNNEPILFLYTGRKALFPVQIDHWSIIKQTLPPLISVDQAIGFGRVKYIMVDPLFRGLGHMLSPADALVISWSSQYPGSITPVFVSSHGLVRIFAVDQSKLAARLPANHDRDR